MDTHMDTVQAIRDLTREIPLNDYGLPTGIYRVDLLPWSDYQPPHTTDTTDTSPLPLGYNSEREDGELVVDLSGDEPTTKRLQVIGGSQAVETPRDYRIAGFPARALHQAFIELQYDEGFPALDTGLPFWSRLEFEPVEAYEAFQSYLQMNLGRPASIDADEYDGVEAAGTRSIAMLVGDRRESTALAQLYTEYYHTYYWGLRAHAYDLFRVAQYRKQQELRAVETQADHYYQSRRLRHRLQQYMDSEEEFWDLMSPKVAIDMLKTLTQLERISAGMPATGPMSDQESQRGGAPFELIFKNVSNTNRRGDGRTLSEDGEVLDMALEDENATEVLQELIIRAGG